MKELRMKTKLLKINLALLLAFLTTTVFAQTTPQVFDIPLSRPGDTVNLDISVLSAHIEVIGEDRQDASFEISVVEGTRKIITPSGTQSLKTGAYSVNVEEKDNHISVDTDWRANRVKIVARVPHNANLELSTVNDGVVIVNDISGRLVLENTNGPITATNINGSVVAEALNEDIIVSFTGISSDQVTSLNSLNGDLTLGLPPKSGVELHIDSAEGEIVSDFEVDVQASKPVMSRENSRHGVEVSVESVIIANVNGGGTVIKLKTLNGNINITDSSK
jgi:hypothetical protein